MYASYSIDIPSLSQYSDRVFRMRRFSAFGRGFSGLCRIVHPESCSCTTGPSKVCFGIILHAFQDLATQRPDTRKSSGARLEWHQHGPWKEVIPTWPGCFCQVILSLAGFLPADDAAKDLRNKMLLEQLKPTGAFVTYQNQFFQLAWKHKITIDRSREWFPLRKGFRMMYGSWWDSATVPLISHPSPTVPDEPVRSAKTMSLQLAMDVWRWLVSPSVTHRHRRSARSGVFVLFFSLMWIRKMRNMKSEANLNHGGFRCPL